MTLNTWQSDKPYCEAVLAADDLSTLPEADIIAFLTEEHINGAQQATLLEKGGFIEARRVQAGLALSSTALGFKPTQAFLDFLLRQNDDTWRKLKNRALTGQLMLESVVLLHESGSFNEHIGRFTNLFGPMLPHPRYRDVFLDTMLHEFGGHGTSRGFDLVEKAQSPLEILKPLTENKHLKTWLSDHHQRLNKHPDRPELLTPWWSIIDEVCEKLFADLPVIEKPQRTQNIQAVNQQQKDRLREGKIRYGKFDSNHRKLSLYYRDTQGIDYLMFTAALRAAYNLIAQQRSRVFSCVQVTHREQQLPSFWQRSQHFKQRLLRACFAHGDDFRNASNIFANTFHFTEGRVEWGPEDPQAPGHYFSPNICSPKPAVREMNRSKGHNYDPQLGHVFMPIAFGDGHSIGPKLTPEVLVTETVKAVLSCEAILLTDAHQQA